MAFFFCAIVEGFARIDADGDDFVFVAGRPRNLAHGFGLAVEDQRAQHRAVVIDQVENHRTALVEIFAQRHRIAVFGDEGQVQIDGRTQMFVDADAFELRRTHVGGERRRIADFGQAVLRRKRKRRQRQQTERPCASQIHIYFFAGSGVAGAGCRRARLRPVSRQREPRQRRAPQPALLS